MLRTALNWRISPIFGIERRIWLRALAFVLGFLLFESFIVEDEVRRFVVQIAADHDVPLMVLSLFYIACAHYLLFVLALLSLASRWRYRFIYIAIFGFAVAVEYGYSRAVGRFTVFYDVASAITAGHEQAIESIESFINPMALLPIAALVICCVFSKPQKRPSGLAHLALFLILSTLFYWHLHYMNPAVFGQSFVSSSYGSFWQSAVDFAILNPLADRSLPRRETVEFHRAGSETPNNNIIFVFDESIRADHLSLNGYSRPTTPYLESLWRDHLLLNWGTAVSAASFSQASYEFILTGATPDMADDLSFDEINTLPTLFQYAKAQNYRTYMFEGQTHGYWGGNPDDLNYIDKVVSVDDVSANDITSSALIEYDENEKTQVLKPWRIDSRMAGMINQIFSQSTGNFVFIYKHGAHFPYEKNYVQSTAPWKPIHRMTEQYQLTDAELGEGLMNSYDDALAFNIDEFFRKLSPDYSALPNNTVVVYTSDHAESFFPNGRSGHGTNAREEALVPLFMLGLKDRSPDTNFKATHANIFSGLLDLMNVPADARKHPYKPSLFEGDSTMPVHRYYNPPPGRKVMID